MPDVPSVVLNNGVEIPQLGFGVFQVKPEETVETVSAALAVGYRHIDTAEMYGNEKEVGRAIRLSEIDPSEVFVTSKLNNNHLGFDAALRAFDQSLADITLEKIDLFLIHWPLPTVRDFIETWRAFERIYSEGRVRSIGVSNFQIHHLKRLFNETEVVPAVNQIEAHPYLSQEELLAFDADHTIATEAWSPIARGAVLGDPVIETIAVAHAKTPAQVVLRWHIQRSSIVFPRSVRTTRIKENFEIFDFELSQPEMHRISDLNRNERIGPDPDTFAMIPT